MQKCKDFREEKRSMMKYVICAIFKNKNGNVITVISITIYIRGHRGSHVSAKKKS